MTSRSPWCPLPEEAGLVGFLATVIPVLESIIPCIIQIITKCAQALGSLDIHSSNSLCGR